LAASSLNRHPKAKTYDSAAYGQRAGARLTPDEFSHLVEQCFWNVHAINLISNPGINSANPSGLVRLTVRSSLAPIVYSPAPIGAMRFPQTFAQEQTWRDAYWPSIREGAK
jgi:hypothetical protein